MDSKEEDCTVGALPQQLNALKAASLVYRVCWSIETDRWPDAVIPRWCVLYFKSMREKAETGRKKTHTRIHWCMTEMMMMFKMMMMVAALSRSHICSQHSL